MEQFWYPCQGCEPSEIIPQSNEILGKKKKICSNRLKFSSFQGPIQGIIPVVPSAKGDSKRNWKSPDPTELRCPGRKLWRGRRRRREDSALGALSSRLASGARRAASAERAASGRGVNKAVGCRRRGGRAARGSRSDADLFPAVLRVPGPRRRRLAPLAAPLSAGVPRRRRRAVFGRGGW